MRRESLLLFPVMSPSFRTSGRSMFVLALSRVATGETVPLVAVTTEMTFLEFSPSLPEVEACLAGAMLPSVNPDPEHAP
ncbi:hypothetical protein HNO51_20385 [Billgrantia sulfidoxydans]|uniref:Secreted protein n=2 Tax=Halomonadaceae TaxID=28256 RepID=A0ABX7WA60_9GAMM|nr:hypothetical protein [Halomonas sulfidoxydans]QTP56831.1 hypothetical protein HNO51_20385 [Halomonas sulfidoxydans]